MKTIKELAEDLGPKLLVSFASAALIAVVIIGLLWHWSDSYCVLAAVAGVPFGWAIGILLAPYDSETTKFQRWSKGLFGFLSGVTLTKLFDLFNNLSANDSVSFLNEVVIRRILVGIVTTLVTTIVVFVARSYWQQEEGEAD